MIYIEDTAVAVKMEEYGYKPREMIYAGTFNKKKRYMYTYNENKRMRQLLSMIEEGTL